MYNAGIVQEVDWQDGATSYYEIIFFYEDGSEGWRQFVVTGKAVCNSTDKYNKEFGKNLAKTKAYEAYHHEVKKLMIAETYRPEWKKKQKDGSSDYHFLTNEEASHFLADKEADKDSKWRVVSKKIKPDSKIRITIEEL